MTKMNEIGKHATVVFELKGYTCIMYHQTIVVKFNSKEIILNSGGYKTLTTKLRMNQTAGQFNLNYYVYQKSHKWYIDISGDEFEFYDGMIVKRNN